MTEPPIDPARIWYADATLDVQKLTDALTEVRVRYTSFVGGESSKGPRSWIGPLHESLVMRLWSMGWHLDLLFHRQLALEKALATRRGELIDNPQPYLRERLNLFFLF